MTTEKQALSFKKLMTDHPLATLGTLAAVPHLIGGGVGMMKDRRDKAHHANTGRAMLELYPGLKRHKPEAARLHGALGAVNPAYASNPTIAGAWVGNVIQSGKDMGMPDKALLSGVSDAGGQRAARTTDVNRVRGLEHAAAATQQALSQVSDMAGSSVKARADGYDAATSDLTKMTKNYQTLTTQAANAATAGRKMEHRAGTRIQGLERDLHKATAGGAVRRDVHRGVAAFKGRNQGGGI
jgi:hypothetical protein